MELEPTFEAALTDLAEEVSKSLRHARETENISVYILSRWANSVETLLDHMTGQHSPEDQPREWWDVKEGVLDEMREMLTTVKPPTT
jgi:hypothetical protein